MQKDQYKKITKCRLCSGETKKILELPNVPIGNDLQKSKIKSLSLAEYPLVINKCKLCNHFQLSISINPNILYKKNYTYLSGVGKNFIEHFEKYSNWVIKRANLNKNDLVVDVGSNDGTCLSFFQKKKLKVCGVDPAFKPAKISNEKGIECLNDFFNEKVCKKILKYHGKPKLITSHNVLAHIEELDNTFKLIYKLLDVDGFFCFEVGYFVSVLQKNNFDTIYHEHLDYHTANSIVLFLNKIGFSVKSITTNNIQGGTIRILTKKQKQISNTKIVEKFIKKEFNILYNNNLVKQFRYNLKENIKNLKEYLNLIKKNKLKIIGYGAPTKAALLSKILQIDPGFLNYSFEDNPLKIDKYIPKTNIKVIHFDKIIMNKFDVVFLFAWNFHKTIIEKLKKNLNKDHKIIIIIPVPKFKIIKI